MIPDSRVSGQEWASRSLNETLFPNADTILTPKVCSAVAMMAKQNINNLSCPSSVVYNSVTAERRVSRMIKPATPANEPRRLKALYDLEILDTKQERVFDGLTSLAAYICKTPMALISLIDSDRQWFKSRYNVSETQGPRETSFCAHAILYDGTFVVEDATKDERFHDNPAVTAENGVRFYAGAPLTTREGYKLGTLCVFGSEPKELSEGQLAALRELSFQVTSQIELRRQIRALTRLNAASK